MSIDSWGGGSDQDPKLRLKENEARERAALMKRLERGTRRESMRPLWIVAGAFGAILAVVWAATS